MSAMFLANRSFNQPINGWNTSSVRTMENMFNQASAFNQYMGFWNTSQVTNMSHMFFSASNFNNGITPNFDFNGFFSFQERNTFFSGTRMFPWHRATVNLRNQMLYWNTGNVTDMTNMFRGARNFVNTSLVDYGANMNGSFFVTFQWNIRSDCRVAGFRTDCPLEDHFTPIGIINSPNRGR
jgi:surface protein